VTRWTTDDIPRLSGLTAVVTGANSGLGFETALALAGAGAHVVLACRDETRGGVALDRIRGAVPAADVRLELLDLADLASVRKFAADFSAAHDGLDILVNNAGVMAIPRRQTSDGFEMQFGTNHLGHFALTGLLFERLLTRPGARPGARVVTVSSEMARIGRIRFDDLQGSRHYGKWAAYGQAKLANQLFTLELDRRAAGHGADLVSVAAHPGFAATNLQAVGPRMRGSGMAERLSDLANAVFAQPAAAGALPSLYAATAAGVRGGQYFGPDGLFGMRGHPTPASFVRAARDLDTARRLWEVSEELTGVRFTTLDPQD
jgi:NAD(P)-dependent dehydrogenase (short-subunit alcohol dehydrogenase family)